MRSRRLLAYTPYKHQEPRLRSLKSPLPASQLADATDSPANLSRSSLAAGLLLAFVALFATAAQAQTTDPIWSTTMTIGEPPEGYRHFRGYAHNENVGSIEDDEFSYAGIGNRVLIVSGDPTAVQINLEEPLELESFDVLVLEFAGEELPFADASPYSNRRFIWDQSWLSDNAPSLSSDFFATTLPLGGTVGVCLRTTEQTCPETASPSTQVLATPEPEIVIVLLRARFRDVPEEHDGSTAFTLQLAFNEPIRTTEEAMQQALMVTNGIVTSAQQVDGRSTLWEIAVTPDSNADVRISLPRDTVRSLDFQTLSRGVAVSIPRAPLRARFEEVPPGHYRTAAFTLQLTFSEPIDTTAVAIPQALMVTGGTMTSVRQVDDRSTLWEIAVTPDSNADVRISLSQTTSCNDEGAVCTEDGRMLSEGVAVSVARMPLTARFEEVPAGHHGSTELALQLVFSEPIGITSPTLERALTVTGDSLHSLRRMKGRSDLWEVEIQPNGSDVRISLPQTTSCDADNAVCTKDGIALQNDAQAVIPFLGYLMPHSLDKVSGDNQSGPANTQLTEPLVVFASDEDGTAMAGVRVSFTVTTDGGMLSSNTDANPCIFRSAKSSIVVITDANGQATTKLTLGSEPGTNTIEVSVPGLEPETFTATATAQAMPHTLTTVCGEDQAGTAGERLAKPLVVLVSDENGAAMAGVAVSFAVTAGGGTLTTTTDTTNATGRARTWLTLGSELGTNTMEATVEGLAPVAFTATGQESPLAGFFDAFLGSGKLAALPNSPQLAQNAPNPFNSQTVLAYFLPAAGPVRLEVFSLTGQRVAVLRHGLQQAGYHRLRWDGRDDAGRSLASGIYLYRLVTDEGILMRKLTLLK